MFLNLLRRLWFYLNHAKCDQCGTWVQETYMTAMFTESGWKICEACLTKELGENKLRKDPELKIVVVSKPLEDVSVQYIVKFVEA